MTSLITRAYRLAARSGLPAMVLCLFVSRVDAGFKGNPLTVEFLSLLPSPMCLGESAPLSLMILDHHHQPVPVASAFVSAAAQRGQLVQTDAIGDILRYAYLADRPGVDTVTIEVSQKDGSQGSAQITLRVAPCDWDLIIGAIENCDLGRSGTIQCENAFHANGTFKYSLSGAASGNNLSGSGTATVFTYISLGNKGTTCELDPPFTGAGPMTISGQIESPGGVAAGDFINLSVNVPPIPWDAAITCNVSGAKTSIPLSQFLPNPEWDPAPLHLDSIPPILLDAGNSSWSVERQDVFNGTVFVNVTRRPGP